jgi:hypothetical protein
MAKAITHKKLVSIYNENSPERYQIKEVDFQSSSDIHKSYSVEEINKVAVMLSIALNLDGGSVGSIDLYQLLQAYILDKEKRVQINKIARGF